MIGLMQGRLTTPLSNKIQEFPWANWENEFLQLNRLGIKLLEWTLDHERLDENPLMTLSGQRRIRELMQISKVRIDSVTLDCFVEAPLHRKNPLNNLQSPIAVFERVIENSSKVGAMIGVLPLVAESGEENRDSLELLFSLLDEIRAHCFKYDFKIALECEFKLPILNWIASQIEELPHIGFNFDIGNSASLDNDPLEELAIYGDKLFNVHIKDRLLGGKTVPLGTGNVDFESVSYGLGKLNYNGNMILQSARGEVGQEFQVISDYIDFCRTIGWNVA